MQKICKTIPPEIGDDEFLYRSVSEMNWNTRENRVSSSAFKNKDGVSVDRDALFRTEQECVNALVDRFDHRAICKIKAQDVRIASALPKYLPTSDNQYHSEIHGSDADKSLKNSVVKAILKKIIVVYEKSKSVSTNEQFSINTIYQLQPQTNLYETKEE